MFVTTGVETPIHHHVVRLKIPQTCVGGHTTPTTRSYVRPRTLPQRHRIPTQSDTDHGLESTFFTEDPTVSKNRTTNATPRDHVVGENGSDPGFDT